MKNVLLVLGLAVTIPVFAQQPANVWTLRQCVDYAVANNLDVKRSVYNRETGDINYFQSKTTMLPSINGNAGYGYSWGRNIDPTTNSFVTERITSANMSLSSSLLLWNGFRQYYSMKQTGAEFEALSEDLIKAKNDVILNVISLYMSVIFNKELYANAQSQLNSTDQQLERTKRLADAGSVPRANVLNLEAQKASNELNLIQRENTLNLSLLQLKQALQLPASTNLDVEVPQTEIDKEWILEQNAEEIFAAAVKSMPEIRAVQLRRKSAEYALRSARGGYYPRLTLNGSLSSIYSSARKEFVSDGTFQPIQQDIGFVQGSNVPVYAVTNIPNGTFQEVSFNRQYNDNLGRSLSLSLTIPIFNGFSTRANVKRATINREQTYINALQQENVLRQAVETAINNATAAYRTYLSAEKQATTREESFRMTKQRFDVGAVNFVEYQIAENELFQAKSDLLRSKYDLLFRKRILDFYQGKPILD